MDGITWAASAMGAAQQRLDIATNDLANAQTDGFVRLVAQGRIGAHGVRIAAVPAAGYAALRPTKRALDLAIVGPGQFFVQTPEGKIITSRDGSFVRTTAGRLLDQHGNRLLGAHGVLHLARGATLDVRQIATTQHAEVRSGWLEASSVDSIAEMIDVMSAQRTFEMAEKVVAAIDSTHQKAAQTVGSLS